MNTEIIPITRKRGRPPGEWREPKLRYRPRKWMPEFSQVVFDYLAIPGITQEELGNKYKYTKEHINNILNSPQAGKIKESVGLNVLKFNEEHVVVKLGEISQKAVTRMHEFIHNDKLYNNSPFAFIDKTLSIRKSIGDAKEKEESFVNNGIVAISGDVAESVMKSFALAMELKGKEVIKQLPEKVANL